MPALDLWPMLEELTIRTKQAKEIKLRRDDPFAWAQREFVHEVERQYNAGLPVRIIVLKGRQLGISTATEAILFLWAFIHKGSNSLVLSKEKEDSQYLYEMLRLYWTSSPFYGQFPVRYNTKNEMVWANGSSVRTGTASKENVGRGHTFQAVHCSEVAFWELAESNVPSLMEAIPYEHGTICVLESTAQGVGGYFHDEWMASTNPTGPMSDFTAMFFPWYRHAEYQMPNTTMTFADLDAEERHLIEKFHPHMTIPKLAWRRRKIASHPKKLDGFHEEYPNDPEEAFLSTGSNAFPLVQLSEVYQPDVGYDRGFLYNHNGRITFADDPSGHLTVYRTPDPRKMQQYAVGVDPTWSLEGDPCCVQVLNRATLEQVAVWHGSADPKTIGEIALALGHWYNTALLNTEIQGGGRHVIDVWRAGAYPRIWTDRRPDKIRSSAAVLGWNTTYETKRWLISVLQSALYRKDLVIHHRPTYHEMSQYILMEDGTYGPARRSGHDDCVMSLGIAYITCATEAQNLDPRAFEHAQRLPPPGMRQLVLAGGGDPSTVPVYGEAADPYGYGPRGGSVPAQSPYFEPGEIDDWY